MDPQLWQRIKEAFAQVAEQPASRRAAALDEACGGDLALRHEVESLLRAHDEPGPAIEPDGFGLAAVMETVEPRYAGRRFGAYRIVRELGRGGMGTVLLAERADGEFQRQVAIKVVRRSLADPDLLRRFRRERQILATLNHPHIAHLLDGGVSEDGEPFLVMEYVEGARLDEHCERAALDTRGRLALFLEVCRAVAYAHERAVVHRDLKPSNILVTTGGVPKLLDFGIAKLTEGEGDGQHTVTAFRAFTPDFAAPEQISGDLPLTPAVDVYSLGMVLAMLLGLPAGAGTGTGTGTTGTGSTARPAARPHADRELRNIVGMACREEPGRRYPTARELADDIERYLAGLPVAARADSLTYRATKFLGRHRAPLAAAGLTLLVLVLGGLAASTIYPASSRGGEGGGPAAPTAPAARAGDASALAGVRTIAVLPLMSLDAAQEDADARSADQALRVGMTDSIVTRLSQVPGLAVRPTSATVGYLDVAYEAVAVGRQLQVDSVLEGTLQRGDGDLRASLQLVDVRSGRVAWADSLTIELADVLRGQASLAHRVSQLLALNLSLSASQGRDPQGPASLAAQDAYLRGTLALHQAVRQVPAVLSARDAFEQAIRLDPTFAAAHAGLASAYTMAGSLTLLSPLEAYPRAERAARRALDLDPELAVAYIALAEVEADYNWNWAAAEANNQRALALAPYDPAAHHSYAELLARLGRFAEAATHADLAIQLDPTRANYLAVRALHYYLEQRFDEAIAQAERALAAEPDTYLAHLYIAASHAAKGETEAGLAASRRAAALTGGSVSDLFVAGCNYAVSGDRANALRIVDRLTALGRGRYVDAFLFVSIHAYLGDRDRAFEFLERAYAERSYWMTTLRVHPVVNSLRGDPRFPELLQRMGLD